MPVLGVAGNIVTLKRVNPQKWSRKKRKKRLKRPAKVAPVDKLSVVLVAFFAVIFLGERPGAREWLGIAMIGGGVLVLAFKR